MAIHEGFLSFVLDEKGEAKGVSSDPSAWRAVVAAEIRRASGRLDLTHEGEHPLLLEVCLRLAGEIGDADALAAVATFEKVLHADPRPDGWTAYVRENLDTEIGIARTKLGLALAWDSAKAAELIRTGKHKMHWQEDLTKWIRRRFRAQDPTGYAALLVEELGAGGPKYQGDLLARLDEVRELRLAGAAGFVRSRLDDKSAAIRVAAARALLALDPKDGAAVATILTAADDAPLVADTGKYGADAHPRIDALNECLDRGLLTPKDVRERLESADSAQQVRGLLQVLQGTKAPPNDDEARAAWRRVLNSSTTSEVLAAVPVSLDLRDRDSRALIVAALDRCDRSSKGQRNGWFATEQVEKLRERLAKELPEDASPK